MEKIETTKKVSKVDEDYITIDFTKLPLSWAILLSTLVFTAGVGAAVYFGLKSQTPAPVVNSNNGATVTPTEEPLPVLGKAEFEKIDKYIKELPGEGNKNAKVVALEFGDYNCSACQYFFREIYSGFRQNYIRSNKVRMYYADAPRTEAFRKAQYYGICINNKYGEDVLYKYHDEMYGKPDSYVVGTLKEDAIKAYLANTLKLDVKALQNCAESVEAEKKIMEYRDLLVLVSGESWATPTFFVGKVENGKVVAGEVTVGAGPGTLEQLADKYGAL